MSRKDLTKREYHKRLIANGMKPMEYDPQGWGYVNVEHETKDWKGTRVAACNSPDQTYRGKLAYLIAERDRLRQLKESK